MDCAHSLSVPTGDGQLAFDLGSCDMGTRAYCSVGWFVGLAWPVILNFNQVLLYILIQAIRVDYSELVREEVC
jgi:hypothetical protein